MADDDIIQRIALLGSDQIRAELNALGKEGEEALKRIEKAGGGDLAKGIRALMPEVAAFNTGLEAAAVSASKLPGILGKISNAVRGLGSGSGLPNLEKDAAKATFAAGNLGVQMRSVGKDIRALGRTIDIAGISGFGRALALTGRNAALIAFPAVIGGIERLSNSAATAASNFADLAAKVVQTPAAFGRLTAVVIALGGTMENAGAVAGTFEKNVTAALESTKAAAEGVATARENLDGVRSGIVDAARSFDDVRASANRARLQFLATGGTLSQYNELNARLREQSEAAGRAILQAGDAAEKAQRAFDKALRATTPLEDAFRQVGITLSESFKKLPIDQQLARIAEGFKNLPAHVDKTKLAVQLLGDEMGRKFVKALSGGEAGLKSFIAEGERVRPTFTAAQIDIGDKMVEASGKLVSSLGALKDAFGLATAPVFTDFFNKMVDIFVSLRPAFTSFGQAVGSVLKPFLEATVVVIQLLIQVGGVLIQIFNGLAVIINKAFGTNLNGVQLFAIAIVALVAAIAPMIPLVLLAVAAVGRLVTELGKIDWAALAKPAVDFWNNLVKFANDAAIGVSNAFNTAIEFVRGLWESLKSTISGWANSVIGFITSVIDKVKELGRWLASLAGAGGDAGSSGSATAGGFATGGEVHGKGTARSDSIWARLSNGEFVVQAAAVRKYGASFLHSINSMRFSGRNFPGFNMGGLVDALAPARAIPAYASGGAVRTGGPESVLNLTIGTEAFFGLRAPEDTAKKLSKFAQRKGARAAGRKPGWYGG